MTLEQKTDHVEEALSHLIDRCKDQPVLTAIFSAFVQQVQDAEDMIWSLRYLLDIQNSSGVQLDVIGRILNQGRESDDDDAYRMYLTVKILTNQSEGTPNELLNICSLITGSDLVYRDLWLDNPADMATARITFLDPLPATVDTNRLDKILERARPAGVMIHTDYHFANPFTYDTAGQGWDDGTWGGGV